MILLIQLIIITSLLVLGYTIATQEKMFLYSIREWANKKQDEGWKIVEPLFLCHWCQPSIWSLLGFVFAFGLGLIKCFTWNILWYYPLVVCGSSLLNGLVWGYHLRMEEEKKYYENRNDTDFTQIDN